MQSIPTQEMQSIPSMQEQIDVATPIKGNVFERNVTIKKNSAKNQSVPVEQIVMLVWLTGILCITLFTIVANTQVFLYVNRQSHITDTEILRLFEQCKKRMLIKREIPLVTSGKLSSPSLLGFIRPKILLSQTHKNMLNEHQLKFVFFHELAHLKRKDVLVNWIMNALLILHWFNPIIWYAYYRMRQDQEIGCDALALTCLDEGQIIEYGHTIIKLLDIFANRNSISSIAKMAGGKRSLKRRILMIKQFQKKSYHWSLLGAVSIIALSAFSFVSADQTSNIVTKKEDQVTNSLKSAGSLVNTNKTFDKSSTLYSPPKQKENFNNMTKEEILTKMINTVDNFETAKGEFKVHYDNIDGLDYSMVDYELSLTKYEGGVSKVTNRVNGNDEVIYHYYKDGKFWSKDKAGTVQAVYKKPERNKTLTLDQAFQTDEQGIYMTKYRERPPIGEAMSSLFPYEIASNYTRNLNNWEIEKQNEMVLGHNTLVIKGKLDDYSRIKHKSDTFRFWVDKDTGILVKYETYDSEGKVVDYLYPKSLEINVPINSDDFTPNKNNN
jgi:beta-lactamase regulating signal transducer with metallopeptidase domain